MGNFFCPPENNELADKVVLLKHQLNQQSQRINQQSEKIDKIIKLLHGKEGISPWDVAALERPSAPIPVRQNFRNI